MTLLSRSAVAVLLSLSAAQASAQPDALSESYRALSDAVVKAGGELAKSVSSAAQKAEESDPLAPVVLEEQSFEPGRSGISLSEAVNLCETHRGLHESRYFYVYCVFHQKNWTETRIGYGAYTAYRTLGYITRSYSSSIEVSGRRSTLWGLYRREGRVALSSSYYSQEPVIAQVQVPYRYTYEVQERIYGLRIMGLGRLDPNAPAKTIFSSREMFGGTASFTFPGAKEAFLACKEAMIVSGNDAKYYRAECVTVKDAKTGLHYYEVQSRNPFL